MQNIQNNEKIGINDIKNSITELKNEIIDFDSYKEIQSNKTNDGLTILGELLGFLRRNKYMSLLMICKKIDNIYINENYAEIEFLDESENELFSNDSYREIITQFLSEKNLSLKKKEKVIEEDDIQKLNKLLNGKLIIKHSENGL